MGSPEVAGERGPEDEPRLGCLIDGLEARGIPRLADRAAVLQAAEETGGGFVRQPCDVCAAKILELTDKGGGVKGFAHPSGVPLHIELCLVRDQSANPV